MLDLAYIDIDYNINDLITTQVYDTWDLHSFLEYADEQYLPHFIYANRYVDIGYYVPPHIKINIPLIDTTPQEKLPPWKRK